MKSKRSKEGYIFLDNRHGPAHTHEQAAEFQRKTGHELIGAGLRGVMESATITCSHCQKTVVLNPQRTRERGWCTKCDHYICDSPACNAGCRPIRQVFELVQAQAFLDNQRGNPASTNALIAQLRRDIL
jgi:hypothetical protein